MKFLTIIRSKLLLFVCGAVATHAILIPNLLPNLYAESAERDSNSDTIVVSAPSSIAPVLAQDSDLSGDDTVFIRTEVRSGIIESRDIRGEYWRYDIRSETFKKLEESERRSVSGERDRESFDYSEYIAELEDRPEGWATHLRKVPRVSVRDIRINVDEYVTRSITSRGKIVIHGRVEGDVTSEIAIIVSPTGMIDGDAFAPRIRVRDGGVITGAEGEGDISEIPGLTGLGHKGLGAIIEFEIVVVFATILVVFLAVAFVAISAKPVVVSRISSVIEGEALRSTWIGILVFLSLPLAITALFISIVGIPVAILSPLIILVGVLLGLVSSSQISGKLALRAYGVENSSQIRQVIVGASILVGLWMIVAVLIASSSEFLEGWGIFFLIASILYSIPAVFSGIGGVFLTRFGRIEYTHPSPEVFADTVPPPPTPPPIPSPPETSGSGA